MTHMTKLVVAAVSLGLCAGLASAQPIATRQAEVGGATGNPAYPLRVIGTDGNAYNCEPGIETVDNLRVRRCIPAEGEVAFGSLNDGQVVAAAVGVAALVALIADDDDATTTTTTTTSSD